MFAYWIRIWIAALIVPLGSVIFPVLIILKRWYDLVVKVTFRSRKAIKIEKSQQYFILLLKSLYWSKSGCRSEFLPYCPAFYFTWTALRTTLPPPTLFMFYYFNGRAPNQSEWGHKIFDIFLTENSLTSRQLVPGTSVSMPVCSSHMFWSKIQDMVLCCSNVLQMVFCTKFGIN